MTFPRAVGFSKEQRTRRAGNTLGHQANGWMLSGSNTSLGGRTLGQQTLFLKPAGPPEPHSHLSECRFPVWIYFRKRLPVMYAYKNDMLSLSVQYLYIPLTQTIALRDPQLFLKVWIGHKTKGLRTSELQQLVSTGWDSGSNVRLFYVLGTLSCPFSPLSVKEYNTVINK